VESTEPTVARGDTLTTAKKSRLKRRIRKATKSRMRSKRGALTA